MDARLHHLAPDTDRFAALMQRRSLAGFHFEPLPPLKVRDRYLDTAAGALLAAGWTLRLRAQDGQGRATLRPLDGSDGSASLPTGSGLGQHIGGEIDRLPVGPVRTAAEALAGSDPLGTLVALRQYRTPRAIYDGQRLVGVLSLDVVTDDLDDALESWHEVEMKRAPSGTANDLCRLGRELAELDFAPLDRSKFERALFRVGRDADVLLLLPDERVALEALRTDDSALARRRAEVVLLAAEGLPTRKISYKASLSPSRVRHWKHAFRHDRMDIFDMDEPSDADGEDSGAVGEVDGFRVSELVEPRDPEAPPSEAAFVDIFDEAMERAVRHPGTPMLGGEDAARESEE